MKKDITALFCFVDDFVKFYDKKMKERAIAKGEKQRKPTRVPRLTMSEILTIVLLFQISPCKNFKYFYESYLQDYNNDEFHNLVSYPKIRNF